MELIEGLGISIILIINITDSNHILLSIQMIELDLFLIVQLPFPKLVKT